MTDYNDGEWHGWNGGKCPVHPLSEVQIVYFQSGLPDNPMTATKLAKLYLWGNESANIVAFRVLKEHREPREWLVYETWDHKIQPCDRHTTGVFKVREVIEE